MILQSVIWQREYILNRWTDEYTFEEHEFEQVIHDGSWTFWKYTFALVLLQPGVWNYRIAAINNHGVEFSAPIQLTYNPGGNGGGGGT